MACKLGFYVHHHGSGHAMRTLSIAAHLPGDIQVFTSAPEHFATLAGSNIQVVALPPDMVVEPEPAPQVFHYAPLGVATIRQRMHLLSQWFASQAAKLLVVDVSAEIVLFARLCSVPVVVVRQHGIRTDIPHLAAYESCQSILAPFSSALEEPATPEWVRQKTFYTGGFSRYAGKQLSHKEARCLAEMPPHQPYVVVVSGQGGTGIPLSLVREAAHACPEWQWVVIGPVAESMDVPSNVQIRGVVPDTFPFLAGADIVVASCGHNTIMEIAATRAKLICIPEPRPFDEQWSKARALARLGVAIVIEKTTTADQWPHLLAKAQELNTNLWELVNDETGAQKAASHLLQMANQWG